MSRASRKLEHLKLALETEEKYQGFEDVHFVHQALPEAALDKTSIEVSVGGLKFSSPIIINAMTGGAYEAEKINQQLSLIAKESNLAMAVGSQMSAIMNKEYIRSFQITRKTNPKGILIANLGSEATVKQAEEAIEMIEADAIQIHLNTVQELLMPEGERDFRGRLDKIQAIKEKLKIPLIVKEVGFGISMETAKKLIERGVRIIDVSGRGGTNFAQIENKRRSSPISFFNDWGIDTATSILETNSVGETEIIASGGIKNSLHIAKAIGLGASAVGMAGSILNKLYDKQVKGTIDYINQLHHELKLIMTSLGANKLLDLQNTPLVIKGDLKDWCELRGIETEKLAK